MHIVYILRCRDDSLYTGYTTDLPARVCAHNTGKGAKYTRGRLPVVPVYQELFDSKTDAMKREMAIKALSRSEKLRLIADFRGSIP